MMPHCFAVLVAHLRQPEYSGLSADAAYVLLTSDKNFRGLRLTQFVSEGRVARTPSKLRRSNTVIVKEDGLSGFPNKIHRETFDSAWRAARG